MVRSCREELELPTSSAGSFGEDRCTGKLSFLPVSLPCVSPLLLTPDTGSDPTG